MKRAYKLIYIVNILLGLILSFSYLFIINYQPINILFYILLCLFYIISTIIFYKNKKDINIIDIIVLYMYLIFTMFMFIFNILIQEKNAYSFIYFNFYIYIYHILYIIYNYFK